MSPELARARLSEANLKRHRFWNGGYKLGVRANMSRKTPLEPGEYTIPNLHVANPRPNLRNYARTLIA